MKPRHTLIWALTGAGFLPLLFKLPYMIQAWRISPLDHGEWGFALGFIVLFLFSIPELTARRQTQRWDWSALAALLPSAAAIFAGYTGETHALEILGAMGFSWSVLWLLWGWRGALLLLPVYGVLALAGTSTRYWLGYLTGPLSGNGLQVKWVLLALLVAGWLTMLWREWQVRRLTLLFHMAAVVVVIMIWQADFLQQKHTPFVPHFSIQAHPEYLGREVEPTSNDLRFFGDCRLEKYFFASDTGSINVLALESGSDIHKIHPAGHCLRSGGWNVVREEPLTVTIGKRQFEVTEIEAVLPELTLIVWVWYSNDAFSTGSFLGFRRNWQQDIPWYIYQVSAPLHISVTDTRRELADFLAAIPVP